VDALESLAALQTPDGSAALLAAEQLAGADPLVAASALRARGIPAELATAALTQAVLRARARAKFGAQAATMFFTRAGLEQATRPAVSVRRAARLAEAGVTRLADLGCGIGSDAIAAARAGIRVHAVEADPLTAAVAAANARVLGLSDRLVVSCVDATTVDLSTVDGVFCDPARRGDGGRRIFDPRSFTPPWDFVAGLPSRVPRTVLKLAPGVDHALIPAGTEAEWVSVNGDVVEAAFWCGPLSRVPRRASLLGDRLPQAATLSGSGTLAAPVGPVRGYLYDPDGAVVRAHLVAEFASIVDGTLADPRIAYVYADSPAATPFGRCFRVDASMPMSVKRLRAELRDRGVGRLTIMKRGSALEPERLRRELRLHGPTEATVILTRVADAPTALLVNPVAAGS
jgi:SAM-dependent methyltransferase